MQKDQIDYLSPNKLQSFIASLSGLDSDEIRQAKLLYVRNAISEYRALQENIEAFGKAQGCMAIIPIFWPIIHAQKGAAQAQLKLGRERIRNTIDVWKEDLQGERFVLDDEEISA